MLPTKRKERDTSPAPEDDDHSEGIKLPRQERSPLDTQKECSLFFRMLPNDITKLIITQYVCFPHYPMLRMVCIRLYNMLPTRPSWRSAPYFVSHMAERGFFRLARWAYELGAPYSIHFKEAIVWAADFNDINAAYWLIKRQCENGFARWIPTVAYECAIRRNNQKMLQLFLLEGEKGIKRYSKSMYLRALLDGDLDHVRLLARRCVRPCRGFLREVATRDAVEFLEPLSRTLIGGDVYSYRFSKAAEKGSVRVLRWMRAQHFTFPSCFLEGAVIGQQRDVITWLLENSNPGPDEKESMGNRAAFRKDIPTLNLLKTLGILPCPKELLWSIAKHKSAELFAWACESGALPKKSRIHDDQQTRAWLAGQADLHGIDPSGWVFE